MKKYLLIVLFIFIVSFNVTAQLIDGPANIREKPNGKVLYSINDNVPVDYRFFQNDWYIVSFTVNVPEADFSIENGISKEAILYDIAGNEIGKAMDNIPVSKENITYHQENHIYTCVLEGYTFKNNLKDSISIVSIADRIKAPNKKCSSLIDIAKSYIEMNQKDNADKILTKLLVTVNMIGLNSDIIGNDYDQNDEKAYQLRDIALLYFRMGKEDKAIEILNEAVEETHNIQGASALYSNKDRALVDFALDFVDFGKYEQCIKTIKMTNDNMSDRALSEIIDKYLTKNDIATAKKVIDLIKNNGIKERKLVSIYLKAVNSNNINTYITLIKSFKNDTVKCTGLSELAVKYFHIKGESNKITNDLLNESLEIAKKIDNNYYRRDELFAVIAGRYAEVKQFEQGEALVLECDLSVMQAGGLMSIAIQYGKINQPNEAVSLLEQAWDIVDKSEEGIDKIGMLWGIVGAYCECGLIDRSLLQAKSIENDAQFYNEALLTVALYYSRNKQPESALNVLQDFVTDERDPMRAGAIGVIVDQLTITNKDEAMRVLSGVTEILDSIEDRDWKYLIGLKNEDYTKIALKYIELEQYNRAIQIIDQKLNNYDVKVSASVKAILMYSKLTTEINKDREDFINMVSNLTL